MSGYSFSENGIEISPRFRRTIEERIALLERDADHDEADLAHLVHADHRRRHMRLIASQRSEAQRMRVFLSHTRLRQPNPMITH